MIRSYCRIAWRVITNNKAFAFLNITGLAIGMASAVLIILWIQNELSFDQFHANSKYIYECYNRGTFDGRVQCWNSTPKILGPTLKQENPGIAAFCRASNQWFVTAVGDRRISKHGLFVDTTFLRIFSFPMLEGDPRSSLNNVNSLVVTESMARAMFGTPSVIGKRILVDGDNFIVSGVLKDLPSNTRFQFDYLMPWSYMQQKGFDDDYWGNNSTNTFVQLLPGADPEVLGRRIAGVTKQHSDGETTEEIFLHPLAKWHLYSDFENGKNTGGEIETVRLFGLIAAFILLVACINFMNLSTARSEKRAREVGIRKVSGATRISLVTQFLGESLFFVVVSGLIALITVQVSLPAFNLLVGEKLSVPFNSPVFWLFALAFVLITGFLAGSYPAFFLSGFKPVSVLKGQFKNLHALVTPRKLLVIVQFTFAIVLVISTITVVKQIHFAQNRSLGYDPHPLVYHFTTGQLNQRYNILKNELLTSGMATSVTRTNSPITEGWSDTWDIGWSEKPPGDKTDFDRFNADEHLTSTAGLTILQGRDMDLSMYPSDSSAVMLNETAVKAMNFKQPIGQLLKDNNLTYRVVGVVKDFVLRSPYEPVKPMVIEGGQGGDRFNVINIRLADQHDVAGQLKQLEKLFRKYNPEYPFEYHFADESYAGKFAETQRTAALAALFAGLTILISCLGLFGLAAFVAAQRTKEIGVRKVLGASVIQLWQLLSTDFVKLVFISFLIAAPVAWYFMNDWLGRFTYRISLSWAIFALAGLCALLITIVTVSYQSIRTATISPSKSLRTE